MSLSRVVKKPGNIVFNEIVQIKEQTIENRLIQRRNTIDPNTSLLSSQIINDAQIEAQRLLDESQTNMIKMKDDFEQECKKVFEQTKLDAYKQGFEEGINASRNDVFNRLELLSQELTKLASLNNELTLNQFEDTQNKIHLLALEIAGKVLRQKLSEDDSILKPIILDELKLRKRQNIHLVEVSRKAQTLIQELEHELTLLGINLHIVDQDVDHMIIEGDMGRYDLSIKTQIKNIKRLFNTI